MEVSGNSSRKVVSINPFRCKMWAMHDRLQAHISEVSCRAEIESFLAHGQVVPVLGRPLRGDPDYEVELIYGARRLFVAQHLNRELLVELRDLSDREAVIAMDVENRQRRDVSPYERGCHYLACMSSGLFASQDELARELGVSPSHISRHLKLSRLPTVVVSAFSSPLEIYESWGIELADALEDSDRRARILQRARRIGSMARRPKPTEIYEQLTATDTPGRKIRRKLRDEVILSAKGAPLFRIRKYHASVAIILPVREISAESMGRIREALADALNSEELKFKVS